MTTPSVTLETKRPAPEPRPSRWSLSRFFGREWSLLLLAAILTAIVWDTMRNEVMERETVSMPLVLPKEHVVLFDRPVNEIELAFDCPKSKLRAIRKNLAHEEGRPRLAVGGLPTSGSRPLSDGMDRIVIPFEERFLQGQKAPTIESLRISGWVYRLVPTAVTFESPAYTPESEALLKERNLEATIRISPQTETIDAPQNGMDATIAPDPIDIRPFLASSATVANDLGPISLTFLNWREATGRGPAIQTWRSQVNLPDNLTATLTLRKRIRKAIVNDVVFMIPDAGRYEFNLDSLPKRPQATTKYEGQLTGAKDVLDTLVSAKGLKTWYWGIRLSDLSKLPQSTSDGEKAILAFIEWVPLPEAQNKDVAFAPGDPTDREFMLKIKRRSE